MADVRVRLPLGAFASAYGKAWQFRLLRKQEDHRCAAAPWFKSNCADSIAEGQLLVVARVC